jgi:hypothetical protein
MFKVEIEFFREVLAILQFVFYTVILQSLITPHYQFYNKSFKICLSLFLSPKWKD